MTGPVRTYTCPKGHGSAEPDYCDTCGAAIAGAPVAAGPGPAASPAAPTPAAVPAAPGERCPVCGTPQAGADRFCENDGYDFVSGRRPDPDPAAAPPPRPAADPAAGPAPGPGSPTAAPVAPAGPCWTATAAADRSYFDRVSVDGVEFPLVCPPRTFELSGGQVRVGRRSASKGIAPEIDLSGPPLDPGISHLHLVLTRDPQLGGWLVVDPGSTNGASLNGSGELLPAQRPVALSDGDRIHLGAWTTLTVHAPG